MQSKNVDINKSILEILEENPALSIADLIEIVKTSIDTENKEVVQIDVVSKNTTVREIIQYANNLYERSSNKQTIEQLILIFDTVDQDFEMYACDTFGNTIYFRDSKTYSRFSKFDKEFTYPIINAS